MNEPEKHPLTLQFKDSELESAFIKEYRAKSLKAIETGLIAGIVVYCLIFGLMDWIQSTNALTEIWLVRGGALVAGLAVIAYGRSENPVYLHEVVSVLIFICGLGLLAMILFDDSPHAYLDGPVLLILPTYVLFRLRFVYATTVGISLFVIYCVVMYFVEGMRATDLFSSVIFLLAANIIGMVAGYDLEYYARKSFWQTRVIDKERKANANLLEVKNRFFANISHEIRTPLTLIVGPIDDLLANSDESLAPKTQKMLGVARRNGDRLLKFMGQLLDLSRFDAKEVDLNLKRGDLAYFLQTEIANLQPYAGSQHVSLELELPDGPLSFATDYEKLDVIVTNLVTNAIKYTPAEGNVHVLVDEDEEGIQITVKDTGIGIAKEDLPKIFDRFYRGKSSELGSGLGLSLTLALVEQLGGDIEAESEEGKGSTFTIKLPPNTSEGIGELEHADKPASVVQDSSPPEMITLEQRAVEEPRAKVLVVEDDPEIRAYLVTCLQEYDVLEAENGEAGLQIITQQVPDLVISDLMMHPMDGRELLRRVRAEKMLSHIPFIILTANAAEKARIENLEEGADDFLTKPFNGRELQLRIRNMLQARRRMQEVNQSFVLMEPSVTEVASSERLFIEQLRGVIDSQLADEHFNGDALAEELGVSIRHLQRKTKALLDETPAALIRKMRLKKAEQLLVAKYGTVAEVAYAVGFNNPAYFTKCFRELFGETPTDWAAKKEAEKQ